MEKGRTTLSTGLLGVSTRPQPQVVIAHSLFGIAKFATTKASKNTVV